MTNDKRLNKFATKYLDKNKQDYGWQLRTARAIVKDIDYLEETCRRLQDNEYLDFIVVPSRRYRISNMLWEKWYLEDWRYYHKDNREDRIVEFIILYEVTGKIINLLTNVENMGPIELQDAKDWSLIYKEHTQTMLSCDVQYFISDSWLIGKVANKLIEWEGDCK